MGHGSGKNASDTPEQHPYVERIRPEPMKLPKEVATLTGLLGRSDRDGCQRLYFTRDLGTFAEFLASDVLFVEPVLAAESPVQGIDASRVTLSRDATVHYTRSTKATALGDFDLDVRTADAGAPVEAEAVCAAPFTPGPCTQITICRGRTCIDVCTDVTCRTDCNQRTCNTCQTRCMQNTCQTCGQNTCVTCQTCPTQCGTCVTCQTCETMCRQNTCVGRTCITCDTCNPHVFTCGPNPQCRF